MTVEFDEAIREKRNPYEYEIYHFLKSKGIQIPEHYVFSSEEEVERGLSKLTNSRKYVVKVISPKIIHKSDQQGVLLGISKSELVNTYEKMENRFANLEFKGVMVTPFVDQGVDLFVGSSIDETFGRLLVFGIGGIFVEIIKDVVFAKPPINKNEALNMVNNLKYKQLLSGVRGLSNVKIESLTSFLVNFSRIIAEFDTKISELDLNPIRCIDDAIIPLDARLILNMQHHNK